ncbi:MAG: helix-turn-helix transcriptional regulator [Clostridia bacterium]|nr:helix-turn-helix transcriptional regulator [Clostridia bacterium]
MSADLLTNLIITNVKDTNIVYSSQRKARVTERKYWSFLIKLTGETLYTCNGKQYVCNQNNVIIAPVGCKYEFTSVVGGEFAYLNFVSPQTHSELIQVPVKNCQPLLASMQKINALNLNKPPHYRILLITETYNMILYLLKNMTPKYVMPANQRKIQPAMDYLIQNYTHPLTNDELSAQTEFSTSYFRKLFRDVYGVSPLEYLQNLRISKAKEMLRNNVGSISEIAASLGYANIYDFSRTFKRETGLSPSAYARNKR